MAEQDLPIEDIQNPSLVEELQARVSKAEAALGQKEEENAALRKQLQEFEARWSDHENSMKSMESQWQKQIEALQVSFHVPHAYVYKYSSIFFIMILELYPRE